MSVAVVWLDDARADLDRNLDHIEQESPRGALSVALAIRKGADLLLSEYPEAGRSGRRRGTRELVISGTPFILIYSRAHATRAGRNLARPAWEAKMAEPLNRMERVHHNPETPDE